MMRRKRNHNKFCGSPGIRNVSLRICPGGFYFCSEKRLAAAILRAVIIVNAAVVLSLLVMAGGCGRQPIKTEIIKAPPAPVEVVISEAIKKEDIKLMQQDCHFMKVPVNTPIGGMVTVREGYWISNLNYMRVVMVLRIFEDIK